MDKTISKFRHDSVLNYTPITFAGEFVRRLRGWNSIANIPSIRTTISIPRFLTARYFRKETLDPKDYFDAAVYNTPFEDQHIARKIAKEMLFPRQEDSINKKTNQKIVVDKSSDISGMNQILNELGEAGFDDLLETMDLEQDLEDLMEDQNISWEFLDELLNSENSKDQARLLLLKEIQEDFAIIQHTLNTRELVDRFIQQQLAIQAGCWSPHIFQPSEELGFGQQLLRHSQMPWETAAAMAITRHSDSEAYINSLLNQVSPEVLGKTLFYLTTIHHKPDQDWQDQAFDRITTMREYYEMIKAMQSFREPPQSVMDHGATYNIRQSMDITEMIDEMYNSDLSFELFDKFLTIHKEPSISRVQDATYDDGSQSWESILETSANREMENAKQPELSDLSKQIANHKNQRLTAEMKKAQTNIAKEVATQNMEMISSKDKFIPELDHMIAGNAIPHLNRTMKAALELGIPDELVLERYNSPIKVMEAYVQERIKDRGRYDRIVRKIRSMPNDKMNSMLQQAAINNDTLALGALGAIDLGQAMTAAIGHQMSNGSLVQNMIAQAVDKSIGGGTNLLQQWFLHRDKLPKNIKDQLKQMMRKTLLEIGLEWANRGTGNTEEGIIPVTRTRPFRAGDELDFVDIEATLSTLLLSGKTLDQITGDELMVTETSRGKTSLGVLIDISGSMTGKNLAMCAIAVVMLLSKMESKEIAIALFESDTHTIKGFDDECTLDEVADELLDLKARGGTRADSALRWISTEFDQVTDSDVKILFFLSDFFLSENNEMLSMLCEQMVQQGVKVLTAYHGRYDRNRMEHMVEIMDGDSMKITNFDNLPLNITDALSSITD